MRLLSMTAGLVALMAALGSCDLPKGELNRGKELYANCVSCHGENGEGTPVIGAPSIGGLPRWYIVTQLQKFRSGARGTHPSDVEGMRSYLAAKGWATPAKVMKGSDGSRWFAVRDPEGNTLLVVEASE